MGYCMTQEDAEFRIKDENKTKVLQAMKELASKQERNSWVINANVLNAPNLASAFHEWAWDIEEDEENGDITGIEFIADKIGDEDILFDTIAPFVEDGCFIEMRGEDGEMWRWVFANGTCKTVEAVVSWLE